MVFTPGMSALIQARLPVGTAHAAMTTGRRYGGYEAQEAGIVDQIADEGKVLDAAVAMARPLAGKAGPTLGAIKAIMYRRSCACCATMARAQVPQWRRSPAGK